MLPSRSPMYDLVTKRWSIGPVATGSACKAFLILVHPYDAAAQLSSVSASGSLAGEDSFRSNSVPSSALRRYSDRPAEIPPRVLPVSTERGRKPEPVMMAYLPEALLIWPTAGSDHVCPTVFSSADAEVSRSP